MNGKEGVFEMGVRADGVINQPARQPIAEESIREGEKYTK